MQFKIIFEVKQPGQLLPLSYQYELSAWIYRLISNSNSEFGAFLHEKGYHSGSKRFKLFTFSNLFIPPRFEIQGDRMKIYSTEISFVLSFLVDQAAQDMIMALFDQQMLTLGDRISQVELSVSMVQMMPKVEIDDTCVRLRATSPILVSEPTINDKGRLRHKYLDPADANYADFFLKNLSDKYQTALEHGLISAAASTEPLSFQLLSGKPKKRGIRIKAFTAEETKIIGYLYDFELTAPPEYIRLGMLAGFGGENAMGFGAVRRI